MRVLLDIPAFLWAVLEPQKLSRKVRKLLQDPKAEIVRSSVSTLEIAAKYRLGRLAHAQSVVQGYGKAISGLQAVELGVGRAHAMKADLWETAHPDPFDRLLAAQAHLEDLPLLTNNRALVQFPNSDPLVRR